jgi:hypothetical protein
VAYTSISNATGFSFRVRDCVSQLNPIVQDFN